MWISVNANPIIDQSLVNFECFLQAVVVMMGFIVAASNVKK
jgi:hypothetical protein